MHAFFTFKSFFMFKRIFKRAGMWYNCNREMFSPHTPGNGFFPTQTLWEWLLWLL